MNSLLIIQTIDSPEVILDSQENIFKISGESRPENAGLFYEPILNWLEEYKKHIYWIKGEFNKTPKINFEFHLEYFNSTSAKYILDIMNVLSLMKKDEGIDIMMYWYYDEMDEDMLDSGKELSSLANIQLVYIKN